MNIARSSTDVLCAQFCQNNHRECRALSQNQAHVRAHCGAQTDATMKISMCARVMIFFQPLLLVNFVVDRNEAYTAKSCLRCTRKSVSEFNLRYLNSIPKRVTVHTRSVGESSDGKAYLIRLNPGSSTWGIASQMRRGQGRVCPPVCLCCVRARHGRSRFRVRARFPGSGVIITERLPAWHGS